MRGSLIAVGSDNNVTLGEFYSVIEKNLNEREKIFCYKQKPTG